ncbi:efflux transporter outer membrane subunit [Microbulbifer sp. YPW16]|uniref:efflux transporter outer membrane subunit n=1 Tax=Microbulbifer sp. YPW16 TaxID=2904242 RepID=UPI001E4EDF79|nr:efflux transporter outer membrane subunit [Microbulbifer sp. YPW16]UHQ56044.1 efflux transporter outer membrane subunit [Microbulbifer sp. YPW16]
MDRYPLESRSLPQAVRALESPWTLLVLVCCLAGCTLGPDYRPPPVPLEDSWSKERSARLDSGQPVDPLWWEHAFSDPVLDQLVAISLDRNLTLRSAALRVMQAQQQLAIAVGNQYPQLQELAGSVSRTKESELIIEEYDIGFNLSWELDMWGRFRRQVESASADLGASVADYDGVLVSLVAQVAQTYVAIRTTQARLKVARNNIDLQEESLRIARAKFEAGEVSALDAEQAEALLYNTRAAVPSLETTLQQLKNTLAVLLGMPPTAATSLAGMPGAIPVVPAQIAIGMPQDLLRQRPDVRAAERRLAAQRPQIGVAEAELYPAFSIGGSIGSRAMEAGRLFEGESEAWNLFGGFQWNLFNYGRLRSNVRLQDARFQQLLEDYRQAVLQAQADVENAIVAYLKSHEQLESYRRAAAASSRSVALSSAQYTNGLVGFNTVISTLTADAQQQDLLARARGAVAANLVQVYRSLGGGWEVRESRSVKQLLPVPVRDEMLDRTGKWKKVLQ